MTGQLSILDLILHAGDIGGPEILDGLRNIADVIAVRGNNDVGAWAKRIPEFQIVRCGGVPALPMEGPGRRRTSGPAGPP